MFADIISLILKSQGMGNSLDQAAIEKICTDNWRKVTQRENTGELKCKAHHCNQNHEKHFCKYCKNIDSDHKSQHCPQKKITISKNTGTKLKCKVSECKENHQRHYCKVCEEKDSDHFAIKCQAGIVIYHGTSLQAAKSILKTGFKASLYGRRGKGIYFTPEYEIAANIAKRCKNQQNDDQFVVLECRFIQSSNFVEKSLHPKWANQIQKISDGPFVEYIVQQQFKDRIKIVKVHEL